MACNDLQRRFQHAEYFTGDPVIREMSKVITSGCSQIAAALSSYV